MIISTIIVDKIEEYTSVLVDFDGFHPDLVNVEMVNKNFILVIFIYCS